MVIKDLKNSSEITFEIGYNQNYVRVWDLSRDNGTNVAVMARIPHQANVERNITNATLAAVQTCAGNFSIENPGCVSQLFAEHCIAAAIGISATESLGMPEINSFSSEFQYSNYFYNKTFQWNINIFLKIRNGSWVFF